MISPSPAPLPRLSRRAVGRPRVDYRSHLIIGQARRKTV